MEDQTFLQKHSTKLWLLGCYLFGAFLVTVFEHDGRFPFKFGEHLAMAMSIAGVIGILIELTLQQELAKNVFRAAIGYLLPEELRNELRWIYDLQFLCIDHVQTVHIEQIPGTDLVKVKSKIERTVKNITGNTQKCPMGLGINEWFYKGHPSKIISYTYKFDGGKTSTNYALHTVREDAGIHLSRNEKFVPKIPLGSGKIVTIAFEYEETKQENDITFIHFGTPTKDITISVFQPPLFEVDVSFSHRNNDPQLVKTSEQTWKLRDTLLPLQAIRIIWYKKQACADWQLASTLQVEQSP